MNFRGRVNPIGARQVQPQAPAPAAAPQGLGNVAQAVAARMVGKRVSPGAPATPAPAAGGMGLQDVASYLASRMAGRKPSQPAAPSPQQGQGRAQQLRALAARQPVRDVPRPALRGLTPDLTGRQMALTQAVLGRRK